SQWSDGAEEREVVLPALQRLKTLGLNRRYHALEVRDGVFIRPAERHMPPPYHVFCDASLCHYVRSSRVAVPVTVDCGSSSNELQGVSRTFCRREAGASSGADCEDASGRVGERLEHPVGTPQEPAYPIVAVGVRRLRIPGVHFQIAWLRYCATPSTVPQ